MKRVLLLSATLTVLTAGAAHTLPPYQFTSLGPLPGYSQCFPHDINDLGQVVGDDGATSGGGGGFIWDEDNGMRALPRLPNTLDIHAHAINNVGQVVGYPPFFRGALLWSAESGIEEIGLLGSEAYAINDSGQVVGGSHEGAFMWTRTKGVELLPGLTVAFGINNEGYVAGFTDDSALYASEAAIWHDGEVIPLGTLGGYSQHSQAAAINNEREVVGTSRPPNGSPQQHAVLWDASGQITDLFPDTSEALDINDNGQIVGFGGHVGAFLWDADEGIIDLNTLLGVSGEGWYLSRATAINNLGQIVGTGIAPSGQREGFLLEPIPEPSTILALLCGLGGLVWHRRSRGG